MARGLSRKVKPDENTFPTLKRLFKYVWRYYKVHCMCVFVLLIVSALTSVASSLFIKTLIDDYISVILLSEGAADFQPLFKALCYMAAIFGCGVLANYMFNRILVEVTQGTLRNIRDDLFAHMETLPIGYFDTHKHGDIMSVYTNDTDTLRQLISQSFPQLILSAITIVGVFTSMLTLSPYLTIVIVIMVFVMSTVTKFITGKSGSYFRSQQQNLGRVNGYIEEMLKGQKVVKVFTHEDVTKAEFEVLNEQLFETASKANGYANILMPVMGNLGNVSYVLIAFIGGLLAINGVGALTLGGLASFLQLTRSFTNPITQISQQLNFVIMASAGAQRIFAIMDEKSEIDQGRVELCNVYEEDGITKECAEVTGKWAWKHPRPNGKVEYVPLVGDVIFNDVDFGYV